MKLLLFDIDGTLIGSNGAGMRAMAAAGRDLFGERFSFEGVEAAGGLDRALFAAAAVNHGLADHEAHIDRFHDRYVNRLAADFRARAAAAAPKPGVMQLLAALRDCEAVALGIVSGNYRRAARIKLKAAGIDPDWFAVSGHTDDGPDRPSLVRHAIESHEMLSGAPQPRRDVIVIGDTPRDVHCAKANGCVAFGVATGPYALAELREAGADVVVVDLTEATVMDVVLGDR